MSEQPAQTSGPFRPELMVTPPERQRRWTVLLRLLLLIPHFIVLWLVSIAAAVVVFIGWFAALILGRLPDWISGFLALFIGYQARVAASNMLLVDKYPPFVVPEPDYPVQVDIRPGELNRWTVFFRIILVIPAAIVSAVVVHGWGVLAFFIWVIVLVAGRNPRPVFDASAAVLRYTYRTNAYFYLLTGAYPMKLFGDARAEDNPPRQSPGTRPLVMSKGGRILLIVFIVLGAISLVCDGVVQSFNQPYYEYQYDYEHDYGR
ncbi:DUF4389 domain-containing protein [Saccharopolyspora phatthalungensis]|uniref:Transmembrane protein n=1 Tax=Saccharopolyspora phatthalungensis TaxID=664693 RepID=A0A840QD18_9PSEU|nr:DUF4389 domain-containing protein [Saccharopolyspora phatthalungensis]MBB5156345.1 hypothetical protein [Saccharopolyspora phatthalungensis]